MDTLLPETNKKTYLSDEELVKFHKETLQQTLKKFQESVIGNDYQPYHEKLTSTIQTYFDQFESRNKLTALQICEVTWDELVSEFSKNVRDGKV